MMGYSATSAMSTNDGETMYHARRRSGTPRERRRVVPPAVAVAASMMDQNVFRACSIWVCAVFSASSGVTEPARASLTFL